MGDLFQIFVISRSTKILIESNFCLEMYKCHIFSNTFESYSGLTKLFLNIVFEKKSKL